MVVMSPLGMILNGSGTIDGHKEMLWAIDFGARLGCWNDDCTEREEAKGQGAAEDELREDWSQSRYQTQQI